MEKIIVFDIDDTLSNFAEVYLEYALEYDKTLRSSGIVYPEKRVSHAFDWSKEEILQFRRNFRSLTHKNAKVKDGAVDLLNKLREHGYVLWFLTARNEKDFDLLFDGTKKWLIENHVPFDKLILETDKAQFLKQQKDVIIYVDDSFDNVVKAKETCPNIKIYLFNSKDNLNKKTDIERIDSWSELEKKILKYLEQNKL